VEREVEAHNKDSAFGAIRPEPRVTLRDHHPAAEIFSDRKALLLLEYPNSLARLAVSGVVDPSVIDVLPAIIDRTH
jgi:hypothetical protein